MHSLIVDHLEELLATAAPASDALTSGHITRTIASDHPAMTHLAQCADCRELVDAMREQGRLFGSELAVPAPLRNSDALEPAPGFYARVVERIESQRPVSVWNLFFDSVFARRLSTASLAVAMVLTGYVISAETLGLGHSQAQQASSGPMQLLPTSDFAGEVFAATPYSNASLTTTAPSGDDVFVSLVTYRER